MTDLHPISVRRLIARLRDVQAFYGTLTDKLHIDTTENSPYIFPADLALFKQVVENGVMADPLFRGPKGWQVLDFLTMLCLQQEADRQRQWDGEKAEINALFLSMSDDAKNLFRAWLKKPHYKLTDSQTFQIFANQ